jgi:hypothetical protein
VRTSEDFDMETERFQSMKGREVKESKGDWEEASFGSTLSSWRTMESYLQMERMQVSHQQVRFRVEEEVEAHFSSMCTNSKVMGSSHVLEEMEEWNQGSIWEEEAVEEFSSLISSTLSAQSLPIETMRRTSHISHMEGKGTRTVEMASQLHPYACQGTKAHSAFLALQESSKNSLASKNVRNAPTTHLLLKILASRDLPTVLMFR